MSMRSLGVSFVVCPSDEDSELAPTEKIVDMSLDKYCLFSMVSAGSRLTFSVDLQNHQSPIENWSENIRPLAILDRLLGQSANGIKTT